MTALEYAVAYGLEVWFCQRLIDNGVLQGPTHTTEGTR